MLLPHCSAFTSNVFCGGICSTTWTGRLFGISWTIRSDGAASGLTVYHRDYPCVGTPQCVRSDDMPGYLGLILAFERPSRSHEVVEKLAWHMCCFATISNNEREAFEEALPSDNANGSGLWIVKDKDVGRRETGPAAHVGWTYLTLRNPNTC